jgi:hypothetical protein
MKHGLIYWVGETIALMVIIVFFLCLVLRRNSLDGNRVYCFFPMYQFVLYISDFYPVRSMIISHVKISLQGYV